MTDVELVQLAAKAVGLELVWASSTTSFSVYKNKHGRNRVWNPLGDDSEAFYLACDLRIDIISCYGTTEVFARTNRNVGNDGMFIENFQNCDIYSATRRAIVRAAAAIGALQNDLA